MDLPFAPAIRGKWTHEAGGTTRNKMDSFQGIMQHKTWQDITAEMDSTRRMWRHQSFFVHCTPMDPWELQPGFRQSYHLIDDIVLTGLIIIEKAVSITFFFIKSDVVKKMHWNLSNVFVNVNMQFWRCGVQNIHRSFVGWTGGAPHSHHFRRLRGLCPVVFAGSPQRPTASREKAPEAGHRSTWRRAGARSRLPSFCSPEAPRWTPRTNMARGLNPGSRRQTSSLADLGRFKKSWDQMITSN